ncbi:GntR family transcriptional regulator [Microbacterium sp. VKM Ac-2870]|uniref:GntR family transcriptional regulator n=1 Tax=Microbacterium sp. VKM Ac-2870 TaxID=2783825 RepID=UPI00188B24DB|nr:GntR family transcriptional regulator [Microbacterium sp. VKM Ac-2870]MBF4562628.1 GntR family transcriptional regulator [Microbacterium sp. VKM Ac-2870]
MSDGLSPLELTSGMILSDEIYARIGEAIVDGRFPPGHRLRDVELARQLGVSRTPVREALQRLERFGLVEIAVGRHTKVTAPDDALRRDTGEFSAYFLGNALNLALSRCSDDQLAELVATLDAAVAGIDAGDGAAVFAAASELGVVACRATGNVVFMAIIHETSIAAQRNLRGWSGVRAQATPRRENWQRLRDLVAARDGAGAEQVVRTLYSVTPGAAPRPS